jgi:DNA-binding MarR family transcriptional regulator
MDLTKSLQTFGFSDYEARAYVALMGREPLNGYELAKAAAVPRPNVYGVLDKLLGKGAVTRLDRPDGTAYAAVAPRELFARLRGEYERLAESVTQELEARTVASERTPVWNLEGYAALLDHAHATVWQARESLVMALWPAEAGRLAAVMSRAEDEGVAITTLCLAACESECGGCRGKLYRYRVRPDDGARTLIALADGREVVAGRIDGDDTTAVRTAQRPVVDLADRAIRNAIALAAVVRDAGAGLGAALTPETGALLSALGPGATDLIFPAMPPTTSGPT